MKEEQVPIYSDGRQVIVTSRELIVDSARYLLNSIDNVRLHFVRHFKYPPLTLIIAGIFFIIAGMSGMFHNIHLEEFYIMDLLITSDRLFLMIGAVLSLMGLLWLSILKNEYVLIISTEEGIFYPLSRKKKEELSKIADVLTDAIHGFKPVNQ